MGDTSMSSFVRVRATSGPLHEFYAAAEEVAVNPDLYHVLDPELVETPGDVVYVEAPRPADLPAPAEEVASEVVVAQKPAKSSR